MQIFNKRYKFVDELGQGAYGKINLAEDIKSGDQRSKFVAIKKMLIDVRFHSLIYLSSVARNWD